MIHHTVTTAIAGSAQVSLVTGSKPCRPTRPRTSAAQPAVRQVHQPPDQRDDGDRQDRRAEEHRAQHRAAAQRVVQRERQEQPESDEGRRGDQHEHDGVSHRAWEDWIVQQIAEIVEPDAAVPATQHVVVLERQPNAKPERNEQQNQEDDEVGQHEQQVGGVLLADRSGALLRPDVRQPAISHGASSHPGRTGARLRHRRRGARAARYRAARRRVRRRPPCCRRAGRRRSACARRGAR